IPSDLAARHALLRRGLIPWIAGIDSETGSPYRRVARLSQIPGEARPLLKLLVEQRLLTTDGAKESDEPTIEPAHEALLRQWKLLHEWLKEDSAALTMLESLKRAAHTWKESRDKVPSVMGKLAIDRELLWSASRLQEAESMLRRLGVEHDRLPVE